LQLAAHRAQLPPGQPADVAYDSEPSVYQRALAEHTALRDAIAAGEAERAGQIAQAHFTITSESLREVLSRGLADGAGG
jgi:GntR family transcriptional regulator, transcriptional repressor for pyruvate dehydrogenase complex